MFKRIPIALVIGWLLTTSAGLAAQEAPGPAPGEVPEPGMTLEEAVAVALQQNPRIGEAAAAVREARARVTQQRALRLPQLGLSGQVFRQGPVLPAFRPGADPVVPPYRWNVGVGLSQLLFDFGQRVARQRAAERNVDASRHRFAETENDVRLVVTTAFLNVLRARRLLEVAEERRAAAAEQLRVSRARFEADVAPRFDVIRSEAELANAEQDVIAARNEVALAEAAFNTSLGRDVNTPVRLRHEPRPPLPDTPYETAREAALESRPQLAALRQGLEALEQEVRARRAENRPQLFASAGYDRRSTTGFSSAYTFEFGLVMTFPFLDSGLTRGRVREARATLEQQRRTLDQARQQMELDVKQALLDLGEARQRIGTAEKEAAAAREALRVAQVRYQAGVGTTVEVTDAQVALARAGQNLANARFDYEAALARLEHATGVPIERLAVQRPAGPGGGGEGSP